MSATLHGVILKNINNTLQLNTARAPNLIETKNINIWKKEKKKKLSKGGGKEA